MQQHLVRHIQTAAETIRNHAQLLTELDSAIGDGDHGSNMQRGFNAVEEKSEEIAAQPPGKALQTLGMTLVSKVGGASGPLYGSLFMAMGKALGQQEATPAALVQAFEQGVEAVKSRGKSQAGEKTMIDVLEPVAHALQTGVATGEDWAALASRAKAAADKGLASTKDMKATKGRASFLGDRSIGHLDPGAQSTTLLVYACCSVLEEE